MATKLGGWYLNGSTLQYRLLNGETLTSTVLASITGLTGLKMEEGKVKVRGTSGWAEITDQDIVITGIEGENTSTNKGEVTFKISDALLGTSKISVSGSTNYTAYLDLVNDASKVHIDGTETIEFNKTAGTAVIKADVTKGFTLNKLDGKATSATYSNAAVNQTLATVTGLQKNYTASTVNGEASTVAFAETTKDQTSGKVTVAGTVTLSKTSTAGEISALGTTAIKVAMTSLATANGINYYLKLGEASGKTYKQVSANDEDPYWSVKGTTATYQYYSPTGYELANAKGEIIATGGTVYKSDGTAYESTAEYDSNATQIKVTAAKTTTVATVTGLASDLTTNVTDGSQIATAVGTGRARITSEFQSGLTTTGTITKPTYKADGKTLETDDNGNVTGKGTATVDISKAVLPIKGNVVVTSGKDFNVSVTTGNDFYEATDSDGTAPTEVKTQKIWVINGTTATYKEVDLAYYKEAVESTDRSGNTITTITCVPQTTGTVLATITGLNADWLEKSGNLTFATKDSSVITGIKGITVTDGSAAVVENRVTTKAAIPGSITLSSEVLGTTNVTIAKSNNYRLNLATEDDSSAGTTKVALPTFKTYKWNLSGTTATLKGTVTAGYTSSDDGKTITYTAGGKNQTLAVVSGLKKGTQLERATTEQTTGENGNLDYRRIGNYIGDKFVEGLSIVTDSELVGGKLVYTDKTLKTSTNDDYSANLLDRMAITLSKHVMDGKVTLNSNFFTLDVDKTDNGTDLGNDATLADKAASRTYVLEKYTDNVYAYNSDTKKDVLKDGADAIIGWHGSLGATATLKQSAPACYELVTDEYGTTKTINYTKPGTAKTLATITGLNKDITENDIEVGTTTGTDGKYTITIKNANALTTSNVKITMPAATTANPDPPQYKLALAKGQDDKVIAELGEATLSDPTWTQLANGTVNFATKVTGAGYKLNADENTITYTKAATTAATLATISGLKPGLTPTNTANTPFEGVVFNQEDGTIALSKSALNNAKVTLSGAGNYKLIINKDAGGKDIESTSENYIVTEKPDPVQGWVINGTSAIYKTVTPEYYEYNAAANTLTYVKPVDSKYQNETSSQADYTDDTTKVGRTIPALGTIKGLKAGLTVNKAGDKIGYYKNGAFVEAISFDTDNKTIIIKDDGVLDYKNSVTLDAAAIATGYSIKLDDTVANNETVSLADKIKPGIKDGTTAEWSISRGTATYKGDVKAGYATAGDGKSIIFSAEKTNTAIATITGLDTTLTEVGNGLAFGTNAGTTDNTNVITVKNSMLGTTNAKLTTNIAILGKNYKLALDAYDATNNPRGVKGKDDAKGSNIWSISGTTATYGTYRDDYYSLNNKTTTDDPNLTADEPADTITYHKAGVASDDKLATVTGLVSGLVTIQNDQIRGITVNDTEGTITLSSNVLPTTVGSTVKVTGENSHEYELALDSTDTSIPTPKDSCLYGITKAGNATLTITRAFTAGFAYDKDDNDQEIKTTLVYKPQDDNNGKGLLGTITGLNKDIEVNKDGGIKGIVVNETDRKITLSRAALTNGDAKLTSSNGYQLSAGSDITAASGDPIWESTTTKGKYNLRTGATAAGYTFGNATITDNVTTQTVEYKDGGDGGSLVATVSGLKNTTDIKVDETARTITIVPSALNAQTIKIEAPPDEQSTDYTLAINTDDTEATDYVAPPKTTNTWTLSNGTATFTQAVFAGYELDQSGDIVYTPASSIVSTFTGLSKEITNAEMSEDTSTGVITLITNSAKGTGIVFTPPDENDSTKGTFEVTDENILAHKNVKLTVKPTGKNSEGTNVTADYTLTLDSNIAAKTAAPIWNKANNATSATLTATTEAGYSLGTDGKSITYSSDPTTATLATVSGLNKESKVAADSKSIGIYGSDGTSFTAGLKVKTDSNGDVKDANGNTIITISNNVLNGTKVNLVKNDKYTFELDTTTSGNEVPVKTAATDSKVWVLNRTAATYKNVTPAYYTLNDTTKQEITYTPQKDKNVEGTSSPNVVTVSGLKSGIKLDSSGKVINADGSTSDGIGYGSETTKKIKLSSAVLGTSKITADNDYIPILDSDDSNIIDVDDTTKWKEQTEWVGSGTTYTYKTYNKGYYTEDFTKKEITYTPPTTGTTFATITGLNSGLTNADISYDNATGTITLGKKQLGTSTVNLKITSGDFKLALDAEEVGVSADPDTETGATASNKVTKSTIKDEGQTWTTNKTTATLTGTKTEGYTLSEDAKSITYQATDKVVTLATVKGIKSGAEIALTNVTDGTGDDTGNKIITLNKTQLGTANVTVTGDGYKLALAADAVSQTDDAAWVKAANATKATFTQKTYNGFIESTDGKSLTYLKATTNVDLATINGLSKDLTKDDMAIVDDDDNVAAQFAAGKLVVLSNESNEITVAKEALSGKVTLGNKDDYTLKLYGTTNGQVGGDVTEANAPKTTFNKSTGTMSIVTGTAAIWKETTDGKSLDYTPEKYTTVATITGIPKTLDADATTGAPTGITVGTDNKITINKAALFDSAGTTSLLANNGKITLTNYTANGGNYTLEAASNSGLEFKTAAPTAADKKKWVLNGTKLSLKEVTSAYYTTASAENTRANTKTQTITYVAEKVGGDLAVITGLPTGSVVLNSDSTAVYVANTTNAAFTNNVNSIDSKDIELSSYLRNAISSATTFTLTSSKGYKFSELPNGTKTPTTGSAGFNETKSYTTLGTKGNATLLQTTTDGWKRESDTKIVYTSETDSVVATFNGLNKNFNPTTGNTDLQLGTGADSLKVTVGKTALTNSNVTVTIPRNGTVYNLALDSQVASTVNGSDATWTVQGSGWKNQTEWVVSGGTANYKTYDKENYYIKPATSATAPNSIVYVKPTAGTSYAAISGMNKNVTSITPETETTGGEIIIRLGAEELEGTSKVTLKTTTPKTVAGADALNAIIAEETVKSAKFRLALDTTTADSITASTIEQAVWDNNGKVANLTGTIKKGYRLSNDQMSVSYQSADSKLQVVAKVTGIKSGSQISDSNVSALESAVTGYNANLPDLQYITLKEEHLSTDNIVLTGEGFKLSLDGGVITNDEEAQWKNQTEWVNSNGTFTYKTYNKANYKLDTNGMRVSYNAAKDDKTNASHKTYLTISGLSKNADATIAAAANVTNGAAADDYKVTSITSANDGVISLSSAVLNKANVKLTDSQNGGYSLVFATDADSLKSTVSNDSAVISGNKATWTGTQGKGYLLANDGQNITYYSAAKTKQNFATVTGLASSVTSANNDAFSRKYDALTNTVSLGAADLSDKVTVGGTAAFTFKDDYTGGTVSGSAAADKMTFGTGGNTINALGGNDVIDVASKGNNVFLYANGNGNDVIKGFTVETDVIRVTNVVGTTSTTKKVNNEDVTTYTPNIEVYQDDKITADAIVRVNKNYIRLKGVNADSVIVYDSKNNHWDKSETNNGGTPKGSFVPATAPSNVLADDNYAMTPTAQLSSIVKSSTSDYMADDLAADDATALTKQSTAVSYSDKK